MAVKSRTYTEREEAHISAPTPKKRTPLAYLRGALFALSQIVKREIRYYRRQPVDTLFFLTYRCTSRCKTCTLWQRTDKSNEMSLEEWKRAVDMCADMGAVYYEMFGGDALLRADVLIPLVAHIKSRPGLCADVVTNCNLMSEKIVRGLVDSGTDNVWISIDGVDETHNRVRGYSKAFNKVEQTVRWFQEMRGKAATPKLHANTTVSNLNYDGFDRVLAYAEEMGMDFMHLEYAGEFWDELLEQSVIDGIRPNPYFVRQDGRSILVTEEQARIVKAKVARMKKDVRRMNISLRSENVDKLTIRQMVTGECDNRRCYITRFKITIDPRGNVLGCGFYGDWILGNIRTRPLKEIWNNESHKRFMKHFSRGDMKLCRNCIVGVQRNPTVIQSVRDYINMALGRARM